MSTVDARFGAREIHVEVKKTGARYVASRICAASCLVTGEIVTTVENDQSGVRQAGGEFSDGNKGVILGQSGLRTGGK